MHLSSARSAEREAYLTHTGQLQINMTLLQLILRRSGLGLVEESTFVLAQL